MPFSQSTQISTIIGFLQKERPSSLLDVGTGMGQYGFLARTNLENVELFDIEADAIRRRPASLWKIRIDGIEGYANYLTPVHDYAYNRMLIGNALDILPGMPPREYDIVLAIDILEHFDRSEGLVFLQQLRRVARRSVLVSTPKSFIEQEISGNPLENHRSHWTREDLESAGFTEHLPNALSWIAVCRTN